MPPEAGTPLSALKRLSPQAREALKRAGVTSLERAAGMSDLELLQIKGVKTSSLARLRQWQVDPAAPEAPSAGSKPDTRESRLWELYSIELARGVDAKEALANATYYTQVYYEGAP